MLIELRIRNYAVIERAAVQLGPGLNVLTGETGAGKSIIVGALSLLLGERASADVVRAGADRAVVEAVVDVGERPEVLASLEGQGIEVEDGLLILRREVAAEGRNRAWVNGSPTTAGLVGELSRRLVDLHGQHEHQNLLRPEEQRAILDEFADSAELAGQVRAAYERLRESRERLAGLDQQTHDIEERAELLRSQVEEIERAELREDEEEALEEDASRLEHAEELARLSGGLHGRLYAAEDAITPRLAELRRDLERLVRIDPARAEAAELLESAYYNLEELGRQMGEYAEQLEHDPRRLDEIHQRQNLIYRLKTKYGPELAGVIMAGRRARAELEALDRSDFDRRELEREAEEAVAALEVLAARLSERRSAGAEQLAEEVHQILPELGLADGRFEVRLVRRPAITANGAESIEFQIALNVGFEPRPLARIASGGELSRVMLALKTILARLDRVPSLVFDEIDVGIGGRVAHKVGEKLRKVAECHQVFVITHLPQIASRADHHLRVEKSDAAGVTATQLTELDEEGRLHEIARMLGGHADSDAVLDHARELLGLRTAASEAQR